MDSVSKQRDLFMREQKPCRICKNNFWGWSNDKKCILCRSPLEDAISINITHTQMLKEQASSGDYKS